MIFFCSRVGGHVQEPSQVQEGMSFRESWCSDTPEQWDRDFGNGVALGRMRFSPRGSAGCVQAAASHQGGCLAETRVLW